MLQMLVVPERPAPITRVFTLNDCCDFFIVSVSFPAARFPGDQYIPGMLNFTLPFSSLRDEAGNFRQHTFPGSREHISGPPGCDSGAPVHTSSAAPLSAGSYRCSVRTPWERAGDSDPSGPLSIRPFRTRHE